MQICVTCFLGSEKLYVKFLQSHPPITETFRFCLIVYLYNMFQPSTGSSSGTNSGTNENYTNCKSFDLHKPKQTNKLYIFLKSVANLNCRLLWCFLKVVIYSGINQNKSSSLTL